MPNIGVVKAQKDCKSLKVQEVEEKNEKELFSFKKVEGLENDKLIQDSYSTILIVDDEAMCSRALRLLLEHLGY